MCLLISDKKLIVFGFCGNIPNYLILNEKKGEYKSKWHRGMAKKPSKKSGFSSKCRGVCFLHKKKVLKYKISTLYLSPTGFEPTTYRLGGGCSILLSYGDIGKRQTVCTSLRLSFLFSYCSLSSIRAASFLASLSIFSISVPSIMTRTRGSVPEVRISTRPS